MNVRRRLAAVEAALRWHQQSGASAEPPMREVIVCGVDEDGNEVELERFNVNSWFYGDDHRKGEEEPGGH